MHDSVGWENVPPPLGAVLSVRFDMGVVGRLARLAGATGRTPSGLIRDWTLERLAALERTENSHLRRIREGPESYRADGPYEELRARYRPPEVRLLLVGESRPAGGAFFYRADSRLFFAVREAFGRALGPVPAGEAFLTFFQRHGAWLYDMAASPVNRRRGRPRTAAVAARVGDLTRVLEDSPAAQVVAIKRDLEAPVRRAMDMARAPVDRLVVLPFPLYQWREVFVSGLAAVVIDMVSGRNKAPQPVRRNRETGSSARARKGARDE
ncbi:MAG TPA: hypothetical protein VMK30_01865 [Pleomorphomonadaceae bacterium]|nr:hypothetical protein [Pleomorphomonadaceae bacterium]